MRIIAFEFAKAINEKLHFAFNIINLDIKLCSSNLSTLLLLLNRILIAYLYYT